MNTLWHLYLLECEGGSLYAGITNNVDARYQKHLSGKGARYTRANPPIRLVGSRMIGSKGDALRAEMAIRKLAPAAKRAFILQSNEDSSVQSPEPATAAPVRRKSPKP